MGKQSVKRAAELSSCQPHFAASNALAGDLSAAQEAMARLRELDPSLRVANLSEVYPVRQAEDLAKLAEGLRKAGLPD